jgi:16S rRNA processing protein rimM
MAEKNDTVFTEDKRSSVYIEAGKIVNTHGVKGSVKIESWCDTPVVLSSLTKIFIKKKSGEFIRLDRENSFVSKKHAVMKLRGIDTLDEALKYKGALVYAMRSDIPREEGSVFICDLIGLPVVDADEGTVYGEVIDYISSSAQKLYAVRVNTYGKEHQEDGKIRYIPDVKQFIDRVDLESGVYIRPIEGLLDEI